MNDAAALYVGKVVHARLRPKPHRFTYRIFMTLIDLDRLDEATGLSRFFSVGPFNLLSFRESDHLPSSQAVAGLAERARALFAQNHIDVSSSRILLLCLPRVMGYAFNPISVFYAVDDYGQLRGLIYEVRNTFGESHAYVVPAAASTETFRHGQGKQFHVSPFLPMDLQYQFSVSTPAKNLFLRIVDFDSSGPLLRTGFSGKHSALSSLTSLKCFFGLPLMTLKVISGIYFEAVRLYFKGMRVYPHPGRGRKPRLERS
jgi:uncharacterized protein